MMVCLVYSVSLVDLCRWPDRQERLLRPDRLVRTQLRPFTYRSRNNRLPTRAR